jgi:hypothetical protein
MTARKSQRAAKREREALAEPTPVTQEQPENQASVQQSPAEIARTRVWELHLRGLPKVRIAAEVNLDRGTVAKIINESYKEVAAERKVSNARKLNEAVARWRRLQEQAWNDHDADDERERQVLALGSGGQQSQQSQPLSAEMKDGMDARPSNVSIRFQSQRSQYLRIILDAEKEIARLEGLYENILDVDGAVGFVVVKREQPSQSDSPNSQSGQIATSATHSASQPRSDTSPDSAADGVA